MIVRAIQVFIKFNDQRFKEGREFSFLLGGIIFGQSRLQATQGGRGLGQQSLSTQAQPPCTTAPVSSKHLNSPTCAQKNQVSKSERESLELKTSSQELNPSAVTYNASALLLRAGDTSATELLSPVILTTLSTLDNSCPAMGTPIGLQAGLSVSSPSDSLENRDEGGYQAPAVLPGTRKLLSVPIPHPQPPLRSGASHLHPPRAVLPPAAPRRRRFLRHPLHPTWLG